MLYLSDEKLQTNQIKQIQNISDTLIEATEHFSKHLNDRDNVQSINIFSAIVEGFQAIQRIFLSYKIDDHGILSKLEKNLVVIMQEMENNNTIKIAEIIQFSLMPNLRKLQNFFTEPTEISFTIGIFHDKGNPKDLYPEARINALNQEADRQNIKLLYFSSDDVDFKRKKIRALEITDNTWKETFADFPDVINNTGASNKHQQSITERKLRRIIPFTSFHVGNKFYLPSIMVKHRQFADLLVPFKMVRNKQIVYDYLEQEKIVVAKPILGARGESIYFIQKKGNRLTVTDHRIERIYNKNNFDEWIDQVLLRKKFSYMVQRYVDCRTKEKEPYDIRAHMQKNEHNEWQITKIYPRIGSKESILSNISRGGRTQELTEFLIEQFGEKTGENYNEELRSLSTDLTKYLDRIHNFSLDELGLDLAIDNTGRFWLHEVNNGPQTTYHEVERAVNTIGYAKYIAENGIVKSKQLAMDENQFNAKASNLPFAEVDERYRIGMLKAKNSEDDEKLAIACAYVAHYEDVQYYTFAPEDVDYNSMLIKGSFYENGEWVNKIVEYPDVIYDRFRLRGVKRFKNVYEELEGIPFTNKFYGNSISKLEVYDKLKTTGELNDVLIPYKRIGKTKDIFDFIDKYGAVIIKPEVGSFARGLHYISKIDKNKYFLAIRESNIEKEIEYTEVELRKYFSNLMEKSVFIVQQYIKSRTIDGHPCDIRIHMMKNGKNEWEFVSIYPRIGLYHATIMTLRIGGYTSKIHGFLKRNYPHHNNEHILQNIQAKANNITSTFSSLYEEDFNEIAFDFALNEDAKVHLIELNVNKPGITFFEFDLARQAIPHAIYMAKQINREKD